MQNGGAAVLRVDESQNRLTPVAFLGAIRLNNPDRLLTNPPSWWLGAMQSAGYDPVNELPATPGLYLVGQKPQRTNRGGGGPARLHRAYRKRRALFHRCPVERLLPFASGISATDEPCRQKFSLSRRPHRLAADSKRRRSGSARLGLEPRAVLRGYLRGMGKESWRIGSTRNLS